MRPLLVVVVEILPQDGFEVAGPEHQRPVEAFDASGPHEPLCERVRPGRAHRGLDHLGTFRPEDLVETGGELRVPVPDQELDSMTGLGQVPDQVPGDLGDKAVVWVFGYPKEVSPPAGVLDGEQDIEPLEQHGVDGEDLSPRCH
jgi:hypothetical protein